MGLVKVIMKARENNFQDTGFQVQNMGHATGNKKNSTRNTITIQKECDDGKLKHFKTWLLSGNKVVGSGIGISSRRKIISPCVYVWNGQNDEKTRWEGNKTRLTQG